MTPRMIGQVPAGTRVDFHFEGTATSDHWDGERPVRGIDYSVFRRDGHLDLDIHGTIGEKRETVGYRASGVSIAHEDQSASPRELITFQTGNEDLAWLNTVVGVAIGDGRPSGELDLVIYIVRP